MTIEGFDRVIFGSKDFDKTMAFFADVLGLEMEEMKKPEMAEAGLRVGLSFKDHVELISFTKPPTDQTPPHIARIAGLIEESDNAVILAVSFKVSDADAAVAEMEGKGVRITGRLVEDEIPSQGVVNLNEIFLDAEDTLGLGIAFAQFDWAKAG